MSPPALVKQFEEILTAKPGVGKQFEDSSSNLFSLFFMCLWIYILPQADVYNEFFKWKTWLEGYLLTLFKHCPGMLLFSQFWQYRLEGDGLFPSNAQAIWYQVCPMGSVLFLCLCLEAYHLFVCLFFYFFLFFVVSLFCRIAWWKTMYAIIQLQNRLSAMQLLAAFSVSSIEKDELQKHPFSTLTVRIHHSLLHWW